MHLQLWKPCPINSLFANQRAAHSQSCRGDGQLQELETTGRGGEGGAQSFELDPSIRAHLKLYTVLPSLLFLLTQPHSSPPLPSIHHHHPPLVGHLSPACYTLFCPLIFLIAVQTSCSILSFLSSVQLLGSINIIAIRLHFHHHRHRRHRNIDDNHIYNIMPGKSSASLATVAMLALSCLVPQVSAFWRLPCDFPVVVERADPVVDPGAVSGHLHTIMGGNGFDFSMDYRKARSATCSTCSVTQDLSNYWIPTLF